MLLIGAKGHAKEIIDVLDQCSTLKDVSLFDDISKDLPAKLYGRFKIIRTISGVRAEFKKDRRFILALGCPGIRRKMALRFISLGGILSSVVSPRARIGNFEVHIGAGVNIMTGVMVSNSVTIGEGTLLNANSTVHHDTRIGKYCEISPGANITGRCRIGDFCSIGTGAVILPGVELGDNVVVGAGAVVHRNVKASMVVAGVPAKTIRCGG